MAGVSVEHAGKTVQQVFVDEIRKIIAPEQSDDAGLVIARQQARAGNPFPLIAIQWPELLVTDPDEAPFFDGVIGDGDNPCLRLDAWQRNDILRAVFDDSYFSVVVKGCTKAGKGASTAISINLWFDIYDESKVIITSSRYQHAVDVLFGEVARWRRKMARRGSGNLLTSGIFHNEQHYVTVSNPETGEGFSGQHGPRTMFVFDEASSIKKSFFEDAEKQARKMIALLNPRTLSGWAFEAYASCQPKDDTQDVFSQHGKRRCVTVSGADCLNVREKRLELPVAPTGGIAIDGRHYNSGEKIPSGVFRKVKTLIPDQIDYSRFLGIMAHPDKRHTAVFGLGRFPSEDPEKQVVLPSWCELSRARWYDIGETIAIRAFGLDVQRSLDGDDTTLSGFGMGGCAWIESWQYNDLKYHAKRVIDLAADKAGVDLKRGVNPVGVDCDGLGVGVADELRSMGVWVVQIFGGSSSEFKTYGNLRAEMYGMFGRRMNPDDKLGDADCLALPPDAELFDELTSPEKVPSGSDAFRWRLQSKDEVKAKIGRSPDRADSCVYGFHAWRKYEQWSRYEHSHQSVDIVKTISSESASGGSVVVGALPDWAK